MGSWICKSGVEGALAHGPSQAPTCCAGWKQQGDECGIECPRQFWGPDCKELCSCHPHGQCEDVTGQCTCHARRWGPRCEHACQCQHGTCHPRSGACRCEPGCCNVTCPPGLHGVDCAQPCSCHEDSCDPVTGACRLVLGPGRSPPMGVTLPFLRFGSQGGGAGPPGLALSLRPYPRRELSLGRKKAPQRLCGRFSRISMKLPRIPLRRQKLPKVVVAHHDLDNTLNCSFLEPPSGLEQPSPSWSSRASFSSFDTTDEGPVYCVPHEEAASETRDPEAPTVPAEAPAPSPAPLTTQASAEEATPVPASSDSERSASSVEGPGGALYARVARREARPARARDEARGLSLSPSPERRKPPPPDPATKPKVSWIHGKHGTAAAARPPSPSPPGPEAAPSPSKRKRTPSDTSARPEEPSSPRTRDLTSRPPGLAEERPVVCFNGLLVLSRKLLVACPGAVEGSGNRARLGQSPCPQASPLLLGLC
ncbi:Scavenger receptor class F member 2 [Tupaia chinensis]|uniref:Scavenger receptor class F member 2 n=1 Tax=Tupaia chinensis TaxID=246437 RepID=L9KPR9_TUPCH|nr:Scavenger receptor class F member 2 [Tupaia chinensis]